MYAGCSPDSSASTGGCSKAPELDVSCECTIEKTLEVLLVNLDNCCPHERGRDHLVRA